MINFTVGPVQSNDSVRIIGSEQVPYFRTQEFSNMMLESKNLVKEFMNVEDDGDVVFMTGSGTASMEAVVSNVLSKNDKILVINGGSFGQRFVDLCNIYELNYTEIKLEVGKDITKKTLSKYDNCGYSALLVNIHETSTGVHYSMNLLSEFCKNNNMLFIVDAISSFLADELDMKNNNIDVIITGSQKALACPPGVSIIALSKRTIDLVYKNDFRCLYLNIKNAIENGKRGQTPFTPAVGILRQINARLKEIKLNGGVNSEIEKTKDLADYFRRGIKDLPLEFVTKNPSNAVTSLRPINGNAYDIFLKLKDDYGIWICPNGGELKEKIFRVGHIGYLKKEDYDLLIGALRDLHNKGVF